jgi:hypothetical protein
VGAFYPAFVGIAEAAIGEVNSHETRTRSDDGKKGLVSSNFGDGPMPVVFQKANRPDVHVMDMEDDFIVRAGQEKKDSRQTEVFANPRNK